MAVIISRVLAKWKIPNMLDIPFISHFFQLIVYWTYLSDFQKLPRLIICNPLSIQRKFQRISLSELVYRIFQGKTRSKTKISQRTARCHITVLVNLLQLLRANYSAVLWLPLVCSRGAGGLGFNLCCFFCFFNLSIKCPEFFSGHFEKFSVFFTIACANYVAGIQKYAKTFF